MRGLPDFKHSFLMCQAAETGHVRKDWNQMKDQMSKKQLFALYSCCFICHAPQGICQMWVAENRGWKRDTTKRCQFDNIIMPAIIASILEGCCMDSIYRMMKNWIEEGDVRLGDWYEIYRWFGQKDKWGDVDISRLAKAFHKIAKEL